MVCYVEILVNIKKMIVSRYQCKQSHEWHNKVMFYELDESLKDLVTFGIDYKILLNGKEYFDLINICFQK